VKIEQKPIIIFFPENRTKNGKNQTRKKNKVFKSKKKLFYQLS
jgi:hypothetical protein